MHKIIEEPLPAVRNCLTTEFSSCRIKSLSLMKLVNL
jgi:hypothetical protein